MKKIRLAINDTLYINNDLIINKSISIRLTIGLIQLNCETIDQEKQENIFYLDYPRKIIESYKEIQTGIKESGGSANKKNTQNLEAKSKETYF